MYIYKYIYGKGKTTSKQTFGCVNRNISSRYFLGSHTREGHRNVKLQGGNNNRFFHLANNTDIEQIHNKHRQLMRNDKKK